LLGLDGLGGGADVTTFWLRKLASPAGIALVLICLFLPFVGVACESGMGKVEVEITGWDMVVGGEPSISTTGVFNDVPDAPDVDQELSAVGRDEVPVQPLMVVFVLALFVAAALGILLRSASARVLSGLIISGFAILILIINQIVVMDDLIDEITGSSPSATARRDAAEFVGFRFGFWLTLLLLAAVLAYNAVDLALSRRRIPTPGSPPGPGPYPPIQQAPPRWPDPPTATTGNS
jgi:hypothetical protein